MDSAFLEVKEIKTKPVQNEEPTGDLVGSLRVTAGRGDEWPEGWGRTCGEGEESKTLWIHRSTL